MFKTIQKGWPQDQDMPVRTFRLAMLRNVLNGKMYDQLKHAFHYEMSDSGEYVPLRQRRPSVRSNLCRTVVDDSVSLLFSEGNFPSVEIDDEKQKQSLARLLKETGLNETMIEAATRGSIGSIAILFRVLKNRVFLRVMETDYLTPLWDPEAPDTLLSVTEKYKVTGAALSAIGYTIAPDDMAANFWFQRVWDASNESWYMPWRVADNATTTPEIDKTKSIEHKLGFVPMVWIKNLPGGDDIDGSPTFPDEAIDTQIEIDYQYSQAGRGLKFMSDPTLVIKEGNLSEGAPLIKGAANAIKVGTDGDAKLLEINGTGVAAVIEYVKHLREVALETMHGNRASNEKISAAQSGRAMELMNQALIWVADKLRISYGEGAILEICSMIVRASLAVNLQFKDTTPVGKFDTAAAITLRWPAWYAPTLQDQVSRASALRTLCDAGLMSRETAIKTLASEYDIEDPSAEKLLADADMQARNDAAQVKVAITE